MQTWMQQRLDPQAQEHSRVSHEASTLVYEGYSTDMHSEGTAGRRKVSQRVEWGVRRQQQWQWKANSRMPHHLTKRTWYFETSPKRSGRRWRPCNYEHGISDLQHLHASRNWRMSTSSLSHWGNSRNMLTLMTKEWRASSYQLLCL